ncbi:MAG: DNA primase [Candidatus Omnitrophica bacterium]|nr:DNA primase [Candidatus Omnitrophota bacterium]
MGLIPQDVINQVVGRSDIVEIIGQYTVLKKAGHNFKACCPFHHEKTPSFVVNPDKQIFHCFGCGVGGDVFGFLMRQEHLEFPEAVRFLANKAGVVIPEEEQYTSSPSRQIREDIFKINNLAAGFFHDLLLKDRTEEAKRGRDYLKERGVDLETVKKFQLGFAPNEWDALLKYLKSHGYPEERVLAAGLIIAREGKNGFYDRFRNRIVFPISDVQNRCVAFGARALSEEQGAKYINSPETAIYTKGQHMFGLNRARQVIGQMDKIIVVEGYMDMIMPYIHGVENISASLGTALTVEQIRLIRRYTSNVVMLYDADAAGQAAMIRSLDMLIDEGMNVRVAALAEGEDPDSFIRQEGLEAFKKRIENAQPLLDFKFNWLSKQHDPLSVEGKSRISQELLATINRFKTEVAKYELTKDLARKLNVPENILAKQGIKTVVSGKDTNIEETQRRVVGFGRSAQELLLSLFLKDPAWVMAAKDKIGPENFSEGPVRTIVEEIWAKVDAKEEWSVSSLLIRIKDETLQGFMTRLVSIDDEELGDTARVFMDCIAKLQKDQQKEARTRLMEAIRQAERAGKKEELDQLKGEFNQLLKRSGV